MDLITIIMVFLLGITARSYPQSIEEVHSLLLNYEHYLNQQNSTNNVDFILNNIAAKVHRQNITPFSPKQTSSSYPFTKQNV